MARHAAREPLPLSKTQSDWLIALLGPLQVGVQGCSREIDGKTLR